MPVKKEREYRTLVAPLAAQSSGEKRLQSECYVEGYATTFNAPYLLYEFEDGKDLRKNRRTRIRQRRHE